MDVYFRQQIDNSRLIRVADPRRQREHFAALVAGVTLFLLLFGYAWMRYRIVRLGYELQSAAQQQARLEQWNRGLELQQAALRNPERIYSLAQSDLGMATPQPGQVLALDVASGPESAAPAVSAMLHP